MISDKVHNTCSDVYALLRVKKNYKYEKSSLKFMTIWTDYPYLGKNKIWMKTVNCMVKRDP